MIPPLSHSTLPALSFRSAPARIPCTRSLLPSFFISIPPIPPLYCPFPPYPYLSLPTLPSSSPLLLLCSFLPSSLIPTPPPLLSPLTMPNPLSLPSLYSHPVSSLLSPSPPSPLISSPPPSHAIPPSPFPLAFFSASPHHSSFSSDQEPLFPHRFRRPFLPSSISYRPIFLYPPPPTSPHHPSPPSSPFLSLSRPPTLAFRTHLHSTLSPPPITLFSRPFSFLYIPSLSFFFPSPLPPLPPQKPFLETWRIPLFFLSLSTLPSRTCFPGEVDEGVGIFFPPSRTDTTRVFEEVFVFFTG